jgi:succinate dehydrogenase / fumarate reductase, cytochrome b subunit
MSSPYRKEKEELTMRTLNYSKINRAGRWFDVRRRKVGMWAYALNRITGIGLVVYLYLHLGVLSLLARGQSAWDSFVSLARSPYYLALDVILLAGVLIHGLNGLRVALTGFDVGVRAQKALFGILMLVAAIGLVAAALKIFGD